MDPNALANFHQGEVMDMNMRHFKCVYQDGRWHCDLCQMSVKYKNYRGRHYREHHNPAAPIYQCVECSYVRARPEQLLGNTLARSDTKQGMVDGSASKPTLRQDRGKTE